MADPLSEIPSARSTRLRARVTIVLFLAATVFLVAITLSPLKSGFADAPSRGPGDVELYVAEAGRIHAGEGYYDAIEAELRQRGYPTRSLFNWRTPLPVWLVGKLPSIETASVVLGALGLTLLAFAFSLLADEGSLGQGSFGMLLLSGALLPCVLGQLVVMSELWAGVLMALSAVLLGLKRERWGVAAGVAALFFRELVAPYCLLCALLAASGRRYRELALWCAGLAAYAVYFGLHAWHVVPRIGASDTAHASGWLQFGGAGFLISTVQMNAYLLLSPQWVSAVYLALVLVGAAEWNTAAGRRIGLTVAGYAVAFSIVGHDFNQYWGSLTAPLFCLPAARAPAALWRLWRQAAGRDAAVAGPTGLAAG